MQTSARELGLPMGRLNIDGGAIALGDLSGGTSAGIVVTLLLELQKRTAGRGFAGLAAESARAAASSREAP